MLLKIISKYSKEFFSSYKKSLLHNANDWLYQSLKSLNKLEYFDSNINYQSLLLKIASNILTSKNIKFLSKTDKEELIINSYMRLFEKSFLKKCIQSTSSSKDFQKYLSTSFRNIFNSNLTVLIHKNNKEESYDSDDYDFELSKKDVSNFIDLLEYKEMISDLLKYLNTNDSCKGRLNILLQSLLDGDSIQDFSSKNGLSYSYCIKIFQELLKTIYKFSVENNYKTIENHLKKFKSLKKSKKISRTVRITKVNDVLSDSYFRDSVMDPQKSSSKLKEEIQKFIHSFEDETTDMIEVENEIVSIESV